MTGDRSIRLVVVDEHHDMRQILRWAFETDPRFRVVGEAVAPPRAP